VNIKSVSSALASTIICFAIVFAAVRSEAQSIRLRVMAANTTSGNQMSYEAEGIRIFQGLKPDIVAIQEFQVGGISDSNTLRTLINTAFGTNFNFYCEPNNGIPNGVVSRYPILDAGFWTDVQVSDRGFVWAQIDLPGTNDLYVVSVHLHKSGGSSSRAIEATNLKALIQGANWPSNAWIIVGGDMNTDARTESAINTFKTFLSDSPIPTDADSGGNEDTNADRDKPYDYVLPSFSLTNFLTSVVVSNSSFPKGLVFDSRVYSPLSEVPPIQFGDSGVSGMQHMAVMKDFLIPTNSAPANTPPSIVVQPQSQTNSVGATCLFSVTANGTAPLAYQWRFFGTNIASATASTYSITNIQTTNAGDYTVVVTNAFGSITSSVATLTINASPIITTNPQNQTVTVGANASFTVAANGAAPLSYQWRFNNTNISGANATNYTRTNAQLADAGNYTVVVTNSAGSVTSAVAVLTVNTVVTGAVVTLAGWDVNGVTNFGVSPLSPTTNAATVSVVGLTRGAGVLTPGGAAARAWGGTGWDSVGANAAVTAGDFAMFSVSANAGYRVSFTSVNKFDYRRSGTGPPSGVLQYQVGAGAFADITNLAYTNSTSSGSSIGPIDLTGIGALQNVQSNTPVTFRIVNHSASGSGGTWYVFDVSNSAALDLSVQGIVSVVTSSNPPAITPVLTNTLLVGSQFQFQLIGTTGSNYIVQATTNLSPVNWIALRTNAAPFTFVESNVFTLPQRFYRGMIAP
jgi:endonuclease/exonuclease/phosphatase family metal-dependent hydrolase